MNEDPLNIETTEEEKVEFAKELKDVFHGKKKI